MNKEPTARILIIEDDPDGRRSVAEAMEFTAIQLPGLPLSTQYQPRGSSDPGFRGVA
jgi:hypothetical protein